MRRSSPVTSLRRFALLLALLVPSVAGAAPFIRGDFHRDGTLDIADPVKILERLFLGGDAPRCLDAGDANDDGGIDIADPMFALGYLFLGGAAPGEPFPDCGDDPTPDALDCAEYAPCRVPNLSEAIGHCGGVPAGTYPNSLRPGDDLHRVTLDAPVAVCNDGTPAVFYVRSAPADSPHADRWVLYFQGGGGCGDFEECLARWCGRQSKAYNESKMSSLYAPEAIGGTGMFLRGAVEGRQGAIENAFGDFNQVFLYYCSSDGWAGRKSDSVLTHPGDASRQYSLHFRGHDIVRATIASLLEGVTSDDGVETVPPLEAAELAIVTGFSAGSGGVGTNGDWIASQLEPNGTVVRLVRDSAYRPLPATHPDPDEARRLAGLLRVQATIARQSRQIELLDAFVDESAHAALAGTDDEWRLADPAYIATQHITTPTFVRSDLLDRGSLENFVALGVTPQDFATMMRTTLLGVPAIATQAAEASEIERPGGSFGSICGDHVGLMANSSFFLRTVEDAGGTPRSYHDTLLRWLQGETVTLVDDPDARTTVCGPEIEELE